MSVKKFLLMVLLDFTGLYFNMRMLWKCFKDKTKFKLLQKCRALFILQCVCQLTILAGVSVQSWMDFYANRPKSPKSCQVFEVLSVSVMFLQAYNLMAILTVYFDRPLPAGNRKQYTKVKIYAALSLGFIGSVIICWYSCFPVQFYSQLAVKALLVVSAVVLFATVLRYDQCDDIAQETSITSPLLWTVFKENKRSVIFIGLLFICLVVVYSELLFFRDFEEPEVFEAPFVFVTKFIFGLILPVTFCDSIDFSSKEEVEMKTLYF